MPTIPLGVYEHYKGKRYRVIGTAKHSETLEDMVVYQPLYQNETAKLWVRPLRMFTEMVEIHGYKKPRFTLVTQKSTSGDILEMFDLL